MRHFRIAIRIALIVLLVVVFVFGWMAACIFWPTSTSDKRKMAAAMIEFYHQPDPHWNENMPASLIARDRQHYRFDPASDVHPDYVSIGYYYRRFGIDYERDFTIVRGPVRSMYLHSPPNETNWAMMSEQKVRLPWMENSFTLNEKAIAITNSP